MSAVWERLSPPALRVMQLADGEAERLGHLYLGDEHVLLGLLGHGDPDTAAVLNDYGIGLAAGRAEMDRLVESGVVPGPRPDDATLLRDLGVDLDVVRAEMEATFGGVAVAQATRRVMRRPRWKGGRRRTPLCGRLLLVKRALGLAAAFATEHGQPRIGPGQLLLGVLADAADPIDAGLSRRGRFELGRVGLCPGAPAPTRLIFRARGIDLAALRTSTEAAVRAGRRRER